MEEQKGKIKRREFLAGLGAAATVGSAISHLGSEGKAATVPPATVASPDPPSAMVPVNWAGTPQPPDNPDSIPVLQNPNILVIMVDQMRQPLWLDTAHQANYTQNFIPNIWGIHQSAVSFDQYYVNATACTPLVICRQRWEGTIPRRPTPGARASSGTSSTRPWSAPPPMASPR